MPVNMQGRDGWHCTQRLHESSLRGHRNSELPMTGRKEAPCIWLNLIRNTHAQRGSLERGLLRRTVTVSLNRPSPQGNGALRLLPRRILHRLMVVTFLFFLDSWIEVPSEINVQTLEDHLMLSGKSQKLGSGKTNIVQLGLDRVRPLHTLRCVRK